MALGGLEMMLSLDRRFGPSGGPPGRAEEVQRFPLSKSLTWWRRLISRELKVNKSSLNETHKWREVFEVNHDRLIAVAAVLCRCECIHNIVELAENQVASSVVHEAFKYKLALRTVVKICVSHVSRCKELKAAEGAADRDYRLWRITSLPEPERMIYFLRDTLGYQRRDVSLLVGMSDEVVDRLLRLARLHLARTSISSSLNPGGDQAINHTRSIVRDDLWPELEKGYTTYRGDSAGSDLHEGLGI